MDFHHCYCDNEYACELDQLNEVKSFAFGGSGVVEVSIPYPELQQYLYPENFQGDNDISRAIVIPRI